METLPIASQKIGDCEILVNRKCCQAQGGILGVSYLKEVFLEYLQYVFNSHLNKNSRIRVTNVILHFPSQLPFELLLLQVPMFKNH